MQIAKKFYLHAGYRKKICGSTFPRQLLGRIVACADWLCLIVNQICDQSHVATRGTKGPFPTWKIHEG